MNFAKAGNVLSVVLDDSLHYNGDATVSYQYDDLHRLTRETCVPAGGSYRTAYDYRYSYDAVGNRTGKTVGSGIGRLEISYGYSARSELTGETTYVVIWNEETQEEEWVQIAAVEYSYDLRGNLVGKRDVFDYWWWWDYYWSADDKLIKAEYSTEQSGVVKTVEYKYDLLGRRVARRLNYGSWRWYFYDGLKVVAEGSGTSDKSYYTLSPSAIGGIISRDNNGTKLFYHFDRLGNVMAVTDSNGRAYAVYTMEAFGNISQAGTSTGYYSSQSDPQPYHLTTKEYDPDSQLYYFAARWYDASTGRFVSRAKHRGDKEHPYSQSQNSPTGAIDPTGRSWMKLLIGTCMLELYDQVDAEYVGGITGDPTRYDLYKHCLVACRARQECCYAWMVGCGAIISFYGLCFEGLDPDIRDVRANEYGLQCAWNRMGCEACCAKKYCHKRR